MLSSACIFGDSVARGVVLNADGDRYTFLKESFVQSFAEKARIAVQNFAKFGCTITKGTQIEQKHAEKLAAFDYTALEFGGNDCDFQWNEISDRPYDEHLPHTPLPEFTAKYEALIADVRAKGGRPVMFSLPPIEPCRYFERITQGLSAKNILGWLGDVGRIYRFHELYNAEVCRIAAAHHVPLIDVRSAFLAVRDYGDLICQDGIHPNAAGHALITGVIADFIREHEIQIDRALGLIA